MMRLTGLLRFHKTDVRRLSFWYPRNKENWRQRLALTYAVSVWSMIGFVAYMQWQDKSLFGVSKKDEETETDLEEEPSQGRKQKITFSASVEYRENHVPYTTRIYKYFTSSNKTSDSGSKEN
ncbi:uncharacterized protein RB166_003587 [Leptodactylus fuscus]